MWEFVWKYVCLAEGNDRRVIKIIEDNREHALLVGND